MLDGGPLQEQAKQRSRDELPDLEQPRLSSLDEAQQEEDAYNYFKTEEVDIWHEWYFTALFLMLLQRPPGDNLINLPHQAHRLP